MSSFLFIPRFLLNMMSFPDMIRNVAVVGHIHHGKTALMDMLVFETHKLVWDADKPVCSCIVSDEENAHATNRFDIPILIHFRERERFPSNLLPCL